MFDKNKNGFLLISIYYGHGSYLENAGRSIPLGLLYIGTILKENGYMAKLLIDDYPDIDKIKDKIKNEHIKIVGFYTSSENIYRVIKCADILKKSYPDIIIILGGPHATILDTHILETEESIDLIVRKEAENTILELAKFYFENISSLNEIKGITYRQESHILRNPDAPLIKDLDTISFPQRDLLDEPLRSEDIKTPRVITGRGCPFKCVYCHEGMSGNNYRIRSVENVMAEVDYLISRGNIEYIVFVDDTFTIEPKRTLKLCRALRERTDGGKKFIWFAEGRVNVLAKHPNLIYEMSMAGIVTLQLGIESSDQSILDVYKKNITLEQIEKVIKTCDDALIPNISINFILGGPFEKEDIYEKHLIFIKKLMQLAPGRVNVGSPMLSPLPGTAITKDPEKYGLMIIDPELKSGIGNHSFPRCETEYLDKYELTSLKRKFERSIFDIMAETSRYLSPQVIFQLLDTSYWSISSHWSELLRNDIGIKRFFNFKNHSNLYFSLPEIEDGELREFYPTRTYPLNYNDKKLVFLEKLYGLEILNSIDSYLYELSSGKRTFKEIISITGENIFKEISETEIYRKICDFYKRMEQIQAIVFARM